MKKVLLSLLVGISALSLTGCIGKYVDSEEVRTKIENNIQEGQVMVKVTRESKLLDEYTIGFSDEKEIRGFMEGKIKSFEVINPVNTKEKIIVNKAEDIAVLSIDSLTEEVVNVLKYE